MRWSNELLTSGTLEAFAAVIARPRRDHKAAANQWLAEAEAARHSAKREGGDGWEISRGDGKAAAEK